MIIVSTEITVLNLADAIGQLQDYQLNELAAYLAQDDTRVAVALEQALNSAIKDL